jgi:CysZ protein
MTFVKDIQYSISSYGKAIDFIFRHKLQWTFLIPVGLNLLLFALGFSFIGKLSAEAIAFFKNYAHPENWDFWGAEFLAGTVGFLIALLLRLFFFLLFAFLGGYVILILLSPLLAYVSEKTEQIETGAAYSFSFPQLIKDVFRGIAIALRNFFLEIVFMILLFFLSFVPLVQVISPFALFLISAYYYGFSFIDYISERRRLSIKESIHFVKRNKGLAIGNGALFALTLLVPFIGVSLAGFMAIISSVAATLALLKKEKSATNFESVGLPLQ